MPSYAFKRAPSNVGDYKLIQDGDKYSFFGNFGTTLAMGSVVNYRVAKSILQASNGWNAIPEFTYETKKEELSGSLASLPGDLYPGNVSYYFIEDTFFAVVTDRFVSSEVAFSETINASEARQEYSIVRNNNAIYVNQLIKFLESKAKGTDERSYNRVREFAYNNSVTESVSGGGDVIIDIPIDRETFPFGG